MTTLIITLDKLGEGGNLDSLVFTIMMLSSIISIILRFYDYSPASIASREVANLT